jgi:hypothetical protein
MFFGWRRTAPEMSVKRHFADCQNVEHKNADFQIAAI